jgi:hypothetical protein
MTNIEILRRKDTGNSDRISNGIILRQAIRRGLNTCLIQRYSQQCVRHVNKIQSQ